jgi:hypothetical protein
VIAPSSGKESARVGKRGRKRLRERSGVKEEERGMDGSVDRKDGREKLEAR